MRITDRNYMNITDVKKVISKHLYRLMGEWFDDNVFYQALGRTIVQANINKFDGLLTMLTDEQGDVMIDALTDNLGDMIDKGYKIDLTTISPLLPSRVLLVSSNDIKSLIDEIKRG